MPHNYLQLALNKKKQILSIYEVPNGASSFYQNNSCSCFILEKFNLIILTLISTSHHSLFSGQFFHNALELFSY